jgi:hypothetical protein
MILLITVLSLVGAQQASAAVRYAAPGGVGPSGLNGCLEGNPCGLELAIEDPAVADGDEVRLLPGPYDIGGNTVVADDAITIHPRDANTRPTISGSAPSMIQITDNATLRDVALIDTTNVGGGQTLSVDPNGALAERVTVKATNTGPGPQFACAVLSGTLRDSTCLMIHSGGSPFDIAVGSASATTPTTGTPRFINVTAAGSGTVRGLLASSNSNDVNISVTAHNMITPNVVAEAGGFPGATASITLTNSNYQSSTATGTGASVTAVDAPTNQSALPLFADPLNGDFHQLPGSPTIDAGAPTGLLGTLDLDFEARSQGSAPDIGADEFTAPPAPQITDTDPNSPADDNSPEVKGTAEANSTVKIYSTADCSGIPLASGTSAQFASTGITIAVADNTTTELRATATNSQTAASPCSAAFAYTEVSPGGGAADTRPPETRIDSAPKRKVKTSKHKAKFEIAFSADEASSFRCSLDGKPASLCSSPFAGKAGVGSHVFQVTATDAAGNADPTPAIATWKVKRKKKHGHH